MSRTMKLAAVLVALALVGLFFVFGWLPTNNRLGEIDQQVADVEAAQVSLRQEIARLEEVRATAPEVEAAILAAESIVPRDVALPATLRQLQLAADEAGVDLLSVAPARPVPIEGAAPGLASMSLALEVEGEYFDVVDFLRRVENPTITARGVVWSSLSVAATEYPTLKASVTGNMFAVLPAVAPPAPPAAPPADGTAPDPAQTDQAATDPTAQEATQ